MKKIYLIALSVMLALSMTVVHSATATLLEVEGFVNPTNAVVTDQGDGTSLLSELTYYFKVVTADAGAEMDWLQVEFNNNVFASAGTGLAVLPPDWTYTTSSNSSGNIYQLGTSGTPIGLGEKLIFTISDILVYNDALTDPGLWQEGQLWAQSWSSADSSNVFGTFDGGSTALVPEPGTLAMFGFGIAGLYYVRRSKTFKI